MSALRMTWYNKYPSEDAMKESSATHPKVNNLYPET